MVLPCLPNVLLSHRPIRPARFVPLFLVVGAPFSVDQRGLPVQDVLLGTNPGREEPESPGLQVPRADVARLLVVRVVAEEDGSEMATNSAVSGSGPVL